MLFLYCKTAVSKQHLYITVVCRLHYKSMDDQDIRNRIVRKMLRKGMIGGHKKQIDTIVNMSLPTYDRGRGRQLLDDMVPHPDAPIEAYGGGHRENVRLTGASAAVGYLKDDGDAPFGFD